MTKEAYRMTTWVQTLGNLEVSQDVLDVFDAYAGAAKRQTYETSPSRRRRVHRLVPGDCELKLENKVGSVLHAA